MLPTTNSQRGVPYDPSAAIAARERTARLREIEQDTRAPAPEACLDGTPRQHARYLDQIESAWKERARDRGRS